MKFDQDTRARANYLDAARQIEAAARKRDPDAYVLLVQHLHAPTGRELVNLRIYVAMHYGPWWTRAYWKIRLWWRHVLHGKRVD